MLKDGALTPSRSLLRKPVPVLEDNSLYGHPQTLGLLTTPPLPAATEASPHAPAPRPAGPSSGKAWTRPDLRSSGRRKGLAPRLPSGLSSFIPLCGKLAPSRMSPLTNSEMTLPQMRRRCLPASLPSFKIYFLSFCHPCSH